MLSRIALLLSLLEEIKCLMLMAQSQSTFLYDFVEELYEIQGSLYELLLASNTAFCGGQFFLFNQLINFNHESIYMYRSSDFYELDEVLAISFDNDTIIAKHGQHALC